MLLYGSVYEVFMWIYYGASGEWVYGVFNWEKQTSVALYVLIPIVYAIIFYVWCGQIFSMPLPPPTGDNCQLMCSLLSESIVWCTMYEQRVMSHHVVEQMSQTALPDVAVYASFPELSLSRSPADEALYPLLVLLQASSLPSYKFR